MHWVETPLYYLLQVGGHLSHQEIEGPVGLQKSEGITLEIYVVHTAVDKETPFARTVKGMI
ncbi:hypothetical protein PHLCEN_2v8806 [Hermanssonia centrifuga]|uniref:Uncharacterized protein n=1 Tax=Hermanssonia centrifuga TaxID=98765 RepID=A0A2R6NSK2_9APHY|nr:hypothetical protein PHLCEN_2v8806 [Hermanssonia centrifuga]